MHLLSQMQASLGSKSCRFSDKASKVGSNSHHSIVLESTDLGMSSFLLTAHALYDCNDSCTFHVKNGYFSGAKE